MKRLAIALAVIATAAIAVAPIALAKHSSHRTSHARKLVRWQHRFHFTLTKTNALGDADTDGVSNVNEFVDNTNPLSKDTNHNGVQDGAEDQNHDGVKDNQDAAATVSSFTAATATSPAILVIKLSDGTMETGQVTDATELKCEPAPVVTTPTAPTTATRDHGGNNGSDDNSGPVQVSTTPVTPGTTGGPGNTSGQGSDDGQGDNSQGGDGQGDGGNNASTCTTAALTVGAVVHSAELKVTSAGAQFKEIELLV